jgi:aminopeptidase N
MKISVAFLCALSMMITAACNTTSLEHKQTERKLEPYLEQSYAILRKHQIMDVNYQLHIELDENSTSFAGEITIDFTLASNNTMPVTVDFDGGEVLSVVLNGKPVQWQHQKWFISFAPEIFAPGKNNLQIRYAHPFATAGDGLHRYKDTETGNVYLYSNFEPYNAHKMFPHFDQPDIKATYLLDVIAPAKWQVISATRETKIAAIGDKQHWSFPKTSLMSSYVFSLHAGNYAVWEDKAGDIPLRLFARQELAQYVNYQEWFRFTQQAFEFYNHYFNYPYPYGKYDQLVVPDFNSGAMENIGAVTFNEAYISRSPKTYLQRMRNNTVISHEMAHMWFGDLVTMKWWNGLWLNESFATYMSYLQMAENSEFKNDIWGGFYNDAKLSAYGADFQTTTHPIELPVANTAEAFTNFDAITYGKGASVLKQLAIFVGEEKFRQGVSVYLKKYANGNTTLENFMDEVAKSSGKNWRAWSDEWLSTAGLNTININFQCTGAGEQSAIKKLEIIQSGTDTHLTLRSQRTQLGFYKLHSENLTLQNSIPVIYRGRSTVVSAANGAACPDFVFGNLNDWAYVKTALDEKQRDLAGQHINDFDNLTRRMLWEYLWDEAQGSKLPLINYVKFVQQNIAGETDQRLAASILSRYAIAANYFWLMTNAGQDHNADLLAMEQFLLQRLGAAPVNSDIQKVLFDIYASMAFSPAGLERLHDYLLGKNLPQSFVVDQDRRWLLLRRLNQFAYQDYRELTNAEQKKDLSDLGQQMAVVCEAIRPDPATKEKWFSLLLAENSPYKFATQRILMKFLFPLSQYDLRSQFKGRIESQLPIIHARNNDRFLAAYSDSLVPPRQCTLEGKDTLAKVRDQYASLGPVVFKNLSNAVQDEERCVNMMKLMAK